MERQYGSRSAKAAAGLVLCAVATYLSIQSGIGLAPWDAFSSGVSNLTGLSYGTVVVITGCVVLLVDILMKEKMGIGTLLDIAIVGKTVDFCMWTGLVPRHENLAGGILMMIAAQFVLAFGIYIYMSAALGCGPRDALMMGIGKRLRRISVGAVRSLMEGAVLLIGWFLGAKVGIGTVIAVFGLGICIQIVFGIAGFNAKTVKHDGFVEMLHISAEK